LWKSAPVVARPTGTVTFLFTDLEGSTRLWEAHPAEMRPALAVHDEIIRDAIASQGGYLFSTGGDGFAAAFASVGAAVAAARYAQAALAAATWPSTTGLRVRMGIHTGEANERGADYFGPAVNRAARIMAAGHGGQVLLSGVSAQLLGTGALIHLADLGEHRLKDLGQPEHLWQLGDTTFPALRTLDRRPHNLRVQRTPLLGRGDDIEAVARHVAAHRLVSLLGIGGSGKTRLAQAVAASLIDQFPDGVWFVDLVPVATADAIPAAIATAAGLDLGTVAQAEALVTVMVDRRALFVLDNCEHLTNGVADLLDLLLDGTVTPRFLVTSREPLELADEQRMAVDPLDASGVGSPAVELFVSTAARGGGAVDEAALAAVLEICRCLDGLPLAIELTAGQARHLDPAEILERLDRRFELVARGRSRGNRRQASLEGVLVDTWALLDDLERGLLLHLAAFPSSFDLETAEELFGPATPRPLSGLVDPLWCATLPTTPTGCWRP